MASRGTSRRSCARSATCLGEFAPYDGGTYTFIADYLPWANGDGMEHRNSTIMTSSSSIRTNRDGLLGTVSHEFFHSWNVERIRPKSLEPFNFDAANMSGELWLAEGFTNYYGPLALQRAGLTPLQEFTATLASADQRRHVQAGPAGPQRGGDEPDGAVCRCGCRDRSHGLREHVHLVLHVGRSDRRSVST